MELDARRRRRSTHKRGAKRRCYSDEVQLLPVPGHVRFRTRRDFGSLYNQLRIITAILLGGLQTLSLFHDDRYFLFFQC